MANITMVQFMCLTFFLFLEFINATEVNVAFYKPTYQNDGKTFSTSSLAVDGNPNTSTTILSSYHQRNWWCVDLLHPINITRIETRTSYGYQINLLINDNGGCSTSVFNSASKCKEDLYPLVNNVSKCYNGQSITARTVFVTTFVTRFSYRVALNSLSIFAAECPEGYYRCNSSGNCVPCPCLSGICNPDNGKCKCNENCAFCDKVSGYCLQCLKGKYGNVCENNCPNCKHGCQKHDGVCVTTCSNQTSTNNKSCVCNDAFYGAKCDVPCSERCLNKTCYLPASASRPECIEGCVDGNQGPYCQKSCPVNCSKCQRFGDGCSICKSGWYGNKCHLSNYGCIPGKTGADCLSDCNANCTSCRQSDNNNCISCKDGRWGRACNHLCSPACIKPTVHQTKIIQPLFANNICHQLTGDCIFGCVVGRKGRNCTKANYVFSPLSTGLIGASSAVVVFTICIIVCKLYNRRKSPDRTNLYSETMKSVSKPRDSYQDLFHTGYVNTSFHNPDIMDHQNEPSNCDYKNYENLPTEIVENLNYMRGQQNQSRDKMHHQQPLVERPRISQQLLYTKVVKKAAGRKPTKRLFGKSPTKAGKKAGQSKVSENRSTEQSLELYENAHRRQPKCRQQIDVYVNVH